MMRVTLVAPPERRREPYDRRKVIAIVAVAFIDATMIFVNSWEHSH